MDIKKDGEDVQEVVTPTKPEGDVDPKDGEGDDKTKNFTELRKQLDEEKRKNAVLLKEKEDRAEAKRSLGADEDEDEGDKKPTVEQVVFNRDKKEAVIEWSKTHKGVTPEVWNEIKEKITLKGDETKSEILEKIDQVHDSLPAVRTEREKKIADEARNKAMREFNDDELDLGSGGDIDLGGGTAPQFSPKEKKFLDSFGVSAAERKNIDRNANPNKWTPGKMPTRKFFQPGA